MVRRRPHMRLAKYLATAGVASRRASEEIIRAGRVTLDGETVTDPARDVAAGDAVAVDGRPVTSVRRTGRLRAQQAGRRRVDRPRSAGPPDRGDAGPADRAAVPGGAAGHRHHRADPAHQPGGSRPPAHPSALRGREDLPRGGRRAGARGTRAADAARRGRARGRSHRAGARPARVAPTRSRSRSTRVASVRSSACARRWAIR